MITYKYEMYFNDVWNDVSAYVSTNAPVGDRLDATFNLGSFTFAHITADKFTGIDLSMAVKSWIPVKITVDDDVFRMFTADTSRSMIKKTDPKLYKHEIGLIEATKILKRKTIPDMTVTQPKSQQFTSLYRSEQKTDIFELNNTLVQPSLTVFNESSNTSIVEGNTLKAGNTGEVVLTLDVYNSQYNWGPDLLWADYQKYDADGIVEVTMYINGIEVSKAGFTNPELFNIIPNGASKTNKWYQPTNIVADTPTRQPRSLYLELDEEAFDQIITFKLRTLGNYSRKRPPLVFLPDVHVEDEFQIIP